VLRIRGVRPGEDGFEKDKPAIDTNYAAHLPLLDWMFGSYHMPDEHWPKEYGTLKRLPRTFLRQLVYPFVKTRD
jgi:sterol desaturase/sphingolipid hydroxylase (fatty acid hydroxylase superfamily)